MRKQCRRELSKGADIGDLEGARINDVESTATFDDKCAFSDVS